MDQFTRWIIGFVVQTGTVDDRALCRMFHSTFSKSGILTYLCSYFFIHMS
jgi:hypothetical protein